MILYNDLEAAQASEQETPVTKSNKSNELSANVVSLETVTLSHITLSLNQKRTAQDVL